MADTSTTAVLTAQWSNPAGFLSLLMLIGGSVIQAALAQLSGPRFVPICFSFGWISYIFSQIPALAGDGRLMPAVDNTCKVINLETGYGRTNRSWIIGRLLRDLETSKEPVPNMALRVVVYKAVRFGDAESLNGVLRLTSGWPGWLGLIGILCQLVISIIPVVIDRDWSVIMITVAGTILCLATAALPQWRVEKYACRDVSKKKIGITVGNGSRYVVVILGDGNCLDLEDLSSAESPRHVRPWETRGLFAKPGKAAKVGLWRGLPVYFWATRLFWLVSVLFWAALLLSVAALKANAWFLMAVGTIGTVQNAMAAAARCDPEMRSLKLVQYSDLIGEKAMDVLMDLERLEVGCGQALVSEFFPGGLDCPRDQGEKLWWDAAAEAAKYAATDHAPAEESLANKTRWWNMRKTYDTERFSEKHRGGRYEQDELQQLQPAKPSRGTRQGTYPF
ncbi:hypothetical protein ARSEF4850_009678 [Beauveria asiatica]